MGQEYLLHPRLGLGLKVSAQTQGAEQIRQNARDKHLRAIFAASKLGRFMQIHQTLRYEFANGRLNIPTELELPCQNEPPLVHQFSRPLQIYASHPEKATGATLSISQDTRCLISPTENPAIVKVQAYAHEVISQTKIPEASQVGYTFRRYLQARFQLNLYSRLNESTPLFPEAPQKAQLAANLHPQLHQVPTQILDTAPESIETMFYDPGDGSVILRLYQAMGGTWQPCYWRIQKSLSAQSLNSQSQTTLYPWSELLEKALQLHWGPAIALQWEVSPLELKQTLLGLGALDD